MQQEILEVSVAPISRPKARYSAWFKLLAVLVALAGALNGAQALFNVDTLRYIAEPADYAQSNEYSDQFSGFATALCQVTFQTQTDEDQKRAQLQADYELRVNALSMAYANAVASIRSGTDESGNTESIVKDTYESDFQAALEDYNRALLQLEQDRRAQIGTQARANAVLLNVDAMEYAIVGPEGVVATNTSKLDQDRVAQYFGAFAHMAQIEGAAGAQGIPRLYWLANQVPQGYTMYLAMPQSAYDKLAQTYSQAHGQAMALFWRLLAGVGATLAGLVWLLYAAGRRPASAGVELVPTDRVYLDIQLLLYSAVFGLCFLWVVGLANGLSLNSMSYNRDLYQLGIQALVAVTILCGLLFLTSAAKRAKRGQLLRHTLVFVVLRGIWRGLKRLALGLKVSTRYVLAYFGFVSAYGFIAMAFGSSVSYGYQRGLSFIMFAMGFALVAIALSFVLHKVISFSNLSTAVRRIQAGELGVRVPNSGGTDLAQLAHSINNLADGLKAAVDSEVKAERMRAELVTNVSHDLKTPLTSIVTYVDLLKTEGLASENAPHYLDVIDQKAARLKTLTADLFEAAKAASGTLPVTLERVDANALLAQGLSELSDRILASGLDMKLQLPADRLLLRADGRLLWRVMENLLSNVFKYAMKGSRVYLAAGRQGGRGVLTLKNISAYELNIAPEELTERFTRGDASRHSEGSGLGLSIARSLTELQGGELRIEIDGDLFKAIVSLPVWEE